MAFARWLPLLLLLAIPGNLPLADFLHGQVVGKDGPIAGAVVRYQAEPFSATTDAAGRFHLPRPAFPRRITASADGFLIAGISSNSMPLRLMLQSIPGGDCERYVWVDPVPDGKDTQRCGNCHKQAYREWSLSGHARSASNRRFLNLYDGSDWTGKRTVGWNLLADHPNGSGVCTSCHAPTVAFGDDAFYDLRQVQGVPARGVHCDYCHKVAGAEAGTIGLTHGRFGLKLRRPGEGQLFFGPLDDVDRDEDTYLPLYRQSRYCASCHEGVVFGVHVYGTYSEWLESPARRQGKECQTCHMAPTGTTTNLAPGKGGKPRDPRTLSNHRFFAGTQADMLRQAIQVSVVAREGQVAVEIQVDGAGHRVPTGFPDRHLLLAIEAFDADGAPVPLEKGDALPAEAGKEWEKMAGRLYAKRLTDFDGVGPVPFWRARPEFADTRLTPGSVERATFRFAAEHRRLRVRLLYRRFWPEVTQVKGWPDDGFSLVDQTLKLGRGEETRWDGP